MYEACNFIKKEILRTPFLQNTSRRLLLETASGRLLPFNQHYVYITYVTYLTDKIFGEHIIFSSIVIGYFGQTFENFIQQYAFFASLTKILDWSYT